MGFIIMSIMETPFPHPILDTKLSELQVSREFVNLSKVMGFENIRQMTDLGWGKLAEMPGFDYGWFNELVRLLDSDGLLQLLETK